MSFGDWATWSMTALIPVRSRCEYKPSSELSAETAVYVTAAGSSLDLKIDRIQVRSVKRLVVM